MNMMIKRLVLVAFGTILLSGPAQAEMRWIKCEMQTTFTKPGIADSEWIHPEGSCTKFIKIDSDAKMVSTFNVRLNRYEPICEADSKNCSIKWSETSIEIDGRLGPGKSATSDVDFRRFFLLTQNGEHAVLVTEDYGGNTTSKPNMKWVQEGSCRTTPVDEAKPMPYPPGPHSATYVDARVFPVPDVERDRVLANRYGNTVTGFSGAGKKWFHMWMFHDGMSYLGDGDDITAEGAARKMYIGKEASGAYRLCEQPIPSEGAMGCYPFPDVKIGDRWIEHDIYGDAIFELLPGRQ
jgi:hypothetical protein